VTSAPPLIGAAPAAVVWEFVAPAKRRANAALQRRAVPPKWSSPLPITLGEDVPLEWRAHSPPQGDNSVNARTFQPD